MKKKLLFSIIVICFILGVEYSFSDELEVPAANQVQILKKILSVEKNLLNSKDKEIVIGIIYQSDNKLSKKTAEDFKMNANRTISKANEKIFKFILIDVKNNKDVTKVLDKEQNNMDLLIITQLRNTNYKLINQYSVNNSILTFATNEKVMQNNAFSLGVGYKGNNVQLLFNPKQISAEGYSFPHNIFEYAKKIE